MIKQLSQRIKKLEEQKRILGLQLAREEITHIDYNNLIAVLDIQIAHTREWINREQKIIKIINKGIWVANKQVNASESNLISNHNQEIVKIKEALEKNG